MAEVGDDFWFQLSIVPFVLAVLRYALVVDQGGGGAPEEVVFADRVLQALGVLWVSAQVQAGPEPAVPAAPGYLPSPPALATTCPSACERGRPTIPARPPRPATGPESVRSFIDSLSSQASVPVIAEASACSSAPTTEKDRAFGGRSTGTLWAPVG